LFCHFLILNLRWREIKRVVPLDGQRNQSSAPYLTSHAVHQFGCTTQLVWLI
jgi:hypothetical protein